MWNHNYLQALARYCCSLPRQSQRQLKRYAVSLLFWFYYSLVYRTFLLQSDGFRLVEIISCRNAPRFNVAIAISKQFVIPALLHLLVINASVMIKTAKLTKRKIFASIISTGIFREKLDTYTIYVGRLQGPYGHSDSVTQEFGSEKIEKVVVHHYFRHSPYFAHDIALIKLK